MDSRSSRRTRSLLLVAVACLIAMTIISPLFLKLFVPAGAEWQQLSAIGETYGAASAILSAFALIAIGFSLVLQSKEMRLSRSAAQRTHHLQLMQLQIEHPVLRDALGLPANGLDPRLHIYLNLVLSHWEALFMLGEMPEPVLLEYARNDFFSTQAGRRFWQSSREHRREVAGGKAGARFVAVMDIAWEQSEADEPTKVAAREAVIADRSRPAALVAAAAAAGLIWWVSRVKTRRARP
jgi:hypothetical protein